MTVGGADLTYGRVQQGQGAATGTGNPYGGLTSPRQSPQTGDQNQAAERNSSRSDQSGQRRQDPLTEFQLLVAASTGRQLPIFGAAMFLDVPSTFAPVDNVPVTPDYVVGPGDELRVQIWGQINQQGSYVVDRTGAISIPQLGVIHVAGVRFADLTGFLQRQFGRVYRNFDLNVNMGQLRSIQVFVVGQARQPGSYTIGSQSTLLNALFASGGPLPQGSLRDIQLKRGGATVVHFDLYDLLLRGDKSKDVPLEPGDVIFIPPVGPQVALVGSVNNPAIYELRGETTVGALLSLGGGETSLALGSTVRLERIYEHTMRSVVDVSSMQAGSVVLQPGDMVLVLSIVDRYKDVVTLRGNVANPGRYVWRPGMKISDLIPSKDALVTRSYWQRRNQLGQPTAELGPLPDARSEGSLQVNGAALRNVAPVSVPNGQDQAAEGKLAASTDGTPRRGSTLAADAGGNSVGAALAENSGLFAAKNDVVLSAPDINWSYAVIERQDPMNLKTTLFPFNLGKVVLDRDASANLELLPGDVVTIFSTSDVRVPTSQQTRFVRLEGEFVAAGVYSVMPGETLRQLLVRASGMTPDAYLYASEFTRQSTRRVEEQRIQEYADELEAQVSSETASNSARALNDRAVAAATASAADAQAAIARLRRTEPIGRIVLELKPDSRGIESVPDLSLEDGDRFVVPRVPAYVSVEGQVYSANAFLFERGKRTSDYLRLAGGPDRQADTKRMFLLRADGSVYSRQYGNVERAHLFPGDTVVVPPQITRRAVFRNIVDAATIVSQLGIGIAALTLLLP